MYIKLKAGLNRCLTILACVLPISVVTASETQESLDKRAQVRNQELERLKQEIQKQSILFERDTENNELKNVETKKARPVYVQYIKDWEKKIEQIGTIHYPDIAKGLKEPAYVLASVKIYRDGSLHEVEIRKSSGIPELDERVIRIVKLAAPFKPFPENIKLETDYLSITRKWQFIPGSGN